MRMIFGKSFSRSSAVNCLESRNPLGRFESPCGRITAAATTGPASGPRPASSTPATHAPPHFAAKSFSTRIDGRAGTFM